MSESYMNPKFELVEVAGFKSGLPILACRTKILPSRSLTLPRFMSLEYICAIDGMVNDVPREILNVI